MVGELFSSAATVCLIFSVATQEPSLLCLQPFSRFAVQRYIKWYFNGITGAWDRTGVVPTQTLPFHDVLCYLIFFYKLMSNLSCQTLPWRTVYLEAHFFCLLTLVFFLLNIFSGHPGEYQTRTVCVNTARRWAIEINVVLEKQVDLLWNVQQIQQKYPSAVPGCTYKFFLDRKYCYCS